MAIPVVDAGRIHEAAATFDARHREQPEWQGWETKGNNKYALRIGGRLYPPKEVVALATNIPTDNFSGGKETNLYLTKLGFAVEALKLPSESEVQAALHDLLLELHPASVDPETAYKRLAEHFHLSLQLRDKKMENSEENHWKNRVRQSRRKLVDQGILDPSTQGEWKLRIRSERQFWIEKTHVQGRPDRKEGEYALGKALWSPLRSRDGGDIYANMRRVQPGDVVIHLTDDTLFSGTSLIESFADPNASGAVGTRWEGPAYLVKLIRFAPVVPPLERQELERFRARLKAIRLQKSGLFYETSLNLRQGAYLTEGPAELIAILNEAYAAKNHRPLCELTSAELSQIREDKDPAARMSYPASRRAWLYAPGPRASKWDEFREAKIAAVGWEETGDLSSFADKTAIQAYLKANNIGSGSLVDATQCFDFSHRIEVGDVIFAKRGRREIIGFGTVTSAYRFDEERTDYNHVVDVDWRLSGSWPTASHRILAMKTLMEINDEELLEELEDLLGLHAADGTEESVPDADVYGIEQFVSDTKIDESSVTAWMRLLNRKKQIILQGPPGTGKTYIAERLGRLLISGTAGKVETVQFHPSYGYEDFMHGIRPVLKDGSMIFERLHGRFLKFCKLARLNKAPHVLIIDEINRGNLQRIFGELMYLLEYRDKEIPLAGEDQRFGIPENVYIIGTMNTADRSIAVVDHALRRRFSFIHIGPDYEVLARHLAEHSLPSESLVKALKEVNLLIDDRSYEIGISFFLKDGAKLREHLPDIWQSEIEPYLEELFFDRPAKIEGLRWKSLSQGLLSDWS